MRPCKIPEEVIKAMKKKPIMTTKQIRESISATSQSEFRHRRNVNNYVLKMVDSGKIKRVGFGVYELKKTLDTQHTLS
ncbi:MAG: type IV toxin-antitoxin system AbiEi family antitoxin domain-containing protein [Shewanella sp.]|nr:type IV toxin-antitoxin system AbiEi family antitoxin domain-containing protein [Shewanella sp.]